jgi:DNA-directed RNA polymerase specialized sigma24 family protein
MRTQFEKARGGDPDAQAEIVAVIRSFARAVCRGGGPGGTACDWEDVAQEASRRFFAGGLERFRKAGSERSYLYAIVRTTVLELARRDARRQAREANSALDGVGVVHDPTPVFDARAILRRLAEDCATLLERVFLQGTPYATLAGELNMLESSVRVRVSRCLRQARELVESEVR